MNKETKILVAGATGMLGTRITSSLLDGGGAEVRALVRPGTEEDGQRSGNLGDLRSRGLKVVEGDLNDLESLRAACDGVDVIISAVNGGRELVVDGQKNLIRAAEEVGVGRMIPSDYSVDYFGLDYGDNDFLDMRKEVAEALENSRVEPTFVLNGSFVEIITSPWWWQFDLEAGAFSYYGDGEQPGDFTTISDAARYTAAVATDPRTAGQTLKFAGDVLTMKQLLSTYKVATGRDLEERRLGSVEDLKRWIGQARKAASSPMDYVFQQYHYAVVSGKGKLDRLDNGLYPHIEPSGVEESVRAAVQQG